MSTCIEHAPQSIYIAYKAYNNYQETKAVGGNASVVGSVKNAGQGMMGTAQGLLAGLMGGQAMAGAPAQAAAPAALAEVNVPGGTGGCNATTGRGTITSKGNHPWPQGPTPAWLVEYDFEERHG